jgi:hypothetical protein
MLSCSRILGTLGTAEVDITTWQFHWLHSFERGAAVVAKTGHIGSTQSHLIHQNDFTSANVSFREDPDDINFIERHDTQSFLDGFPSRACTDIAVT